MFPGLAPGQQLRTVQNLGGLLTHCARFLGERVFPSWLCLLICSFSSDAHNGEIRSLAKAYWHRIVEMWTTADEFESQMFWSEVTSTLKSQLVSSLQTASTLAVGASSEARLLNELQLSVGLAYAINHSTSSTSHRDGVSRELYLVVQSNSALILDSLLRLFRPDLELLHTAVTLDTRRYCFFHPGISDSNNGTLFKDDGIE